VTNVIPLAALQRHPAHLRESYAARAGIEATHGQAVHRCALRRCRYIGLAKTHLQHLISAAAINLVRIANWVNGIPTAQTRCSWFAALQKAA
jgi:transposase